MAKAAAVFVRCGFPFNYSTDDVSNETGLKCEDPSLAIQSAKDECDINVIVKRFGLTGQLPANPRVPQFGDFTGISDYQTALNAVNQAESDFLALPAELRRRFDNDPQVMMEFLADENNRAEAFTLGLVSTGTQEQVDAAIAAAVAAGKPLPAVTVATGGEPAAVASP